MISFFAKCPYVKQTRNCLTVGVNIHSVDSSRLFFICINVLALVFAGVEDTEQVIVAVSQDGRVGEPYCSAFNTKCSSSKLRLAS